MLLDEERRNGSQNVDASVNDGDSRYEKLQEQLERKERELEEAHAQFGDLEQGNFMLAYEIERLTNRANELET